ncbi:MAG: helix-turn-helix transcriptional regulator [Kiloniellaceae bacterium]
MIGVASIAEVAALMGDPARANMLFALKDDGWIAAGALSALAGVAPSTASEHLAKLSDAGLIGVSVRGRRRYYSLADPAVAEVLEAIEGLAGTLKQRNPAPQRWDQGLIHARACLDHLAGRLGARLADAAVTKGFIRDLSSRPELTEAGVAWIASLDVDIDSLRAEPRRFLRLCPDWVEETAHIGGAVGAALLKGLVEAGWLRRERGSPKVLVTPKGVSRFRAQLDLDVRTLGG